MGVFTTASQTFAVGDQFTAAWQNGQVRDLIDGFGAHSTYTPTLTASTTNPTLGTGSVQTGRYTKIGRQVVGTFDITFGTAGVAAGSGTYQIGIPTNVYSSYPGNASIGRAFILDSSGSVGGWLDLISNFSNLVIRYQATWPTGSLTYVTNAVPWTWAASDAIRGWFMYESQS